MRLYNCIALLLIFCLCISCNAIENIFKYNCETDYSARPENTTFIKDELIVSKDYEVLIIADRPWEGRLINYASIIKVDRKYEMWYETFPANSNSDFESYICYAYSSNGIDWVKPELGLYTYQGKPTNIVYNGNKTNGAHGPSVIHDGDTYKMIFVGEDYRLFGFSSEDGIVWSEPVSLNTGYGYDSQNSLYFDSQKGEYIIYHRFWKNETRTFKFIKSKDFFNFNESLKNEILGVSSSGMNSIIQFYNPAISYYNNRIFSFPSIYNTDCQTLEPIYCYGDNENQLRCNFRSPIINLKWNENNDINQIYVLPNCLIVDENQLYIYYLVRRGLHGQELKDINYDGEIRRSKVNFNF